MKKLLLSLVFFFSANAFAEDPYHCTYLAQIGRTAVMAKYEGIPMSALLLDGLESDSKYLNMMFNIIVIEAYSQPDFTLKYKDDRVLRQQNQNRVIEEYQRKVYAACNKLGKQVNN